jgi:hypothetical protein
MHSADPILSLDGQVRLIKEWLKICDNGECQNPTPLPCRSLSDDPLPTRLVHLKVKPSCWIDNQDTIRVVDTYDLGTTRNIDYIALSHCWGQLDEHEKPNYTFTGTQRGFLVEKLPQSFEDAVILTRKLGKEYLWVDSLCIIQSDHEDWAKESETMFRVFKNAYCTIAATSAENSRKGFLRGILTQVNSDSLPDDFERNVHNGVLNTRAWVLQERVLSRRTIHFTERQLFWDCGGGITCAADSQEGYMRK